MDWRAITLAAWLAVLAERAPNAVPEAPARVSAQAVAVFSKETFAKAVVDALRDVAQPYKQVQNPLLHTAIVAAAAGPDDDDALRADTLAALLARAAETLQTSPREVPFWNALRLTYFKPAPSQAIASERLDVPFSSYRRHLARGIAHVTETLWRQELAA